MHVPPYAHAITCRAKVGSRAANESSGLQYESSLLLLLLVVVVVVVVAVAVLLYHLLS